MKPPEFEYLRPRSVAEAVAALAASNGEGKVLAGGQSLVPLLNFRLVAPALLVDLNRVAELGTMEVDRDRLRTGAMTRTRALELDPLVRRAVPILAAAASWIGHVQIRNRGTVGGSLAHADPAAELPALALLLEAEMIVEGPNGARTVQASEFFAGFLTTALAEDEVLTEVRWPVQRGERWGFREFAQRRGDFALSGAAVTVGGSGEEALRPRIVVFGTADRPVRTPAAEARLAADGLTPGAIEAAARDAAEAAAFEDARPDAAYRRTLTGALVRRALEDARSGGSNESAGDGRRAA